MKSLNQTMPLPPSAESYAEAMRALEQLHPTTIMELPTAHALILIGALQLAIRHPAFPDTSRCIIVDFIEEFRSGINEPMIMQVIQMGFDPRYDQE